MIGAVKNTLEDVFPIVKNVALGYLSGHVIKSLFIAGFNPAASASYIFSVQLLRQVIILATRHFGNSDLVFALSLFSCIGVGFYAGLAIDLSVQAALGTAALTFLFNQVITKLAGALQPRQSQPDFV